MTDPRQDTRPARRQAGREPTPDETSHDEHPVEPAEGARHPGEDAQADVRAHPDEPAEGRRDIG